MFMKYLFSLATLAALSLWGDVTYVYNKDVEGRETKTTWNLDFLEAKDLLQIKGESLSGETLIVMTPQRVTQSFSHTGKHDNSRYTVHREGEMLIATQTVQGEHTKKTFSIGEDTWVQEFDFGFKPFILSNLESFKFSIVHPKKLSLHQMIATKQGFEPLEIHGKTHEALRIKITLTGLKKMFWHADLWFDPQAGDLLKYRATEGPNTPLSTITLFSKTIN